MRKPAGQIALRDDHVAALDARTVAADACQQGIFCEDMWDEMRAGNVEPATFYESGYVIALLALVELGLDAAITWIKARHLSAVAKQFLEMY